MGKVSKSKGSSSFSKSVSESESYVPSQLKERGPIEGSCVSNNVESGIRCAFEEIESDREEEEEESRDKIESEEGS